MFAKEAITESHGPNEPILLSFFENCDSLINWNLVDLIIWSSFDIVKDQQQNNPKT